MPFEPNPPIDDEVDRIIGEWRQERPEIDADSIGIFGRLSRLQPLQRQAAATLHDEHGLSPAAFDVLASLRRSGPPYRKTVGALAESSLLTSAAVTLRIDRLEALGLVRRVRGDTDRRQVRAELTEEGRRRVDAIFEEHIALERRLLSALTDAERAQLAGLLRKLTASVLAATGEVVEGQQRDPADSNESAGSSSH